MEENIKDYISHIKDKELSYKDVSFSEFFYGKEPFIYVQKKLQKISSVLYILTAFFSENDPLRLKIREAVLNLLGEVSYKGAFVANSSTATRFSSSIIFLVSALGVAREAGYISQMNQRLLESELLELLTIVERRARDINPEPIVSARDLAIKDSHNLPRRDGILGRVEKDVFLETKTLYPSDAYPTDKKDTVLKKSTKKIKVNRDLVPNQKSRIEDIRSIVGDLGEVSIRDVSARMKGVSSKTVQRALLALVASGVLKKTGERRWSKYSLNS